MVDRLRDFNETCTCETFAWWYKEKNNRKNIIVSVIINIDFETRRQRNDLIRIIDVRTIDQFAFPVASVTRDLSFATQLWSTLIRRSNVLCASNRLFTYIYTIQPSPHRFSIPYTLPMRSFSHFPLLSLFRPSPALETYFARQSARTVFAIWWHMVTHAVVTRPT